MMATVRNAFWRDIERCKDQNLREPSLCAPRQQIPGIACGLLQLWNWHVRWNHPYFKASVNNSLVKLRTQQVCRASKVEGATAMAPAVPTSGVREHGVFRDPCLARTDPVCESGRIKVHHTPGNLTSPMASLVRLVPSLDTLVLDRQLCTLSWAAKMCWSQRNDLVPKNHSHCDLEMESTFAPM